MYPETEFDVNMVYRRRWIFFRKKAERLSTLIDLKIHLPKKKEEDIIGAYAIVKIEEVNISHFFSKDDLEKHRKLQKQILSGKHGLQRYENSSKESL